MAILGLGTDIVEIRRIAEALERQSGLAKRLLTADELNTFLTHKEPERFLAKRFAAKEAALKALGTGLQQGIRWQMLHVKNDSLGKPSLHLSDTASDIYSRLGGRRIHISISDERHYAQAVVLIED